LLGLQKEILGIRLPPFSDELGVLIQERQKLKVTHPDKHEVFVYPEIVDLVPMFVEDVDEVFEPYEFISLFNLVEDVSNLFAQISLILILIGVIYDEKQPFPNHPNMHLKFFLIKPCFILGK
jgi:hypothetical protein